MSLSTIREFDSIGAMMAHYRAVLHRRDNPRTFKNKPVPVPAKPVERAPPPPPSPVTWVLDASPETLVLYDTIVNAPVWSPKAKAAHLVQQVAAKHSVTVDDIMGKSRRRYIVRARQEAMAVIYTEFPMWSLPIIGKYFGRDHTTVLHSVKVMGAWR